MRFLVRRLLVAPLLTLAPIGCGPSPEPAAPEDAAGDAVEDTQPADSETPPAKFDDLGFRPATNGFKFENYGRETAVTNLTPREMRRLFGDAACASAADGCTLTPAAAQWMDGQNAGMGGGHCEGMAALSLLFYLDKAKVSDFGDGATLTNQLDLSGNDKLQREIAYWFVTQATDPTLAGEIKTLTPLQIVDKLQEGLSKTAPETFTMGIYQRGPKAGHAITPYKVDASENPIKVYVYDNNFPGAERVLEVDKEKNTWRYFASTSPSVPGSLYEGDGETKTLTLTPTSNRLKPQSCPFCGEAAPDGTVKGSSFSFRELYLQGQANLLITDDASGKKLGWDAGKLVSEIPGARYVTPKSRDLWNDDQEPVYFLPLGGDLTVTLDGSSITGAEPSTVTLIAPAFVLEVDEITLAPGQRDTIKLSKQSRKLVYKTTSKESPTLYAGVTAEADADWFFAIKTYGETSGQEVTLELDLAKKRLVIRVVGSDATADFDIVAVRIDSAGAQKFAHAGNGAKPTDTMYLDYGAWGGDGKPMRLETDVDGDGKPDKSADISDVP